MFQGKNLLVTYDFGDGSPFLENTTETTVSHIYSTQGDKQIKVVAFNNVSTVSSKI